MKATGQVRPRIFHEQRPDLPKAIAITQAKQIARTHRNGQTAGIPHFKILDTNGEGFAEPILNEGSCGKQVSLFGNSPIGRVGRGGERVMSDSNLPIDPKSP